MIICVVDHRSRFQLMGRGLLTLLIRGQQNGVGSISPWHSSFQAYSLEDTSATYSRPASLVDHPIRGGFQVLKCSWSAALPISHTTISSPLKTELNWSAAASFDIHGIDVKDIKCCKRMGVRGKYNLWGKDNRNLLFCVCQAVWSGSSKR